MFRIIQEESVRLRQQKLTRRAMKQLADEIRQHMPEGRLCEARSVHFDFPGSGNTAILRVESDQYDDGIRYRLISRIERDGPYCLSHYIITVPKNEILAYLDDASNTKELLEGLIHLSSVADDRW